MWTNRHHVPYMVAMRKVFRFWIRIFNLIWSVAGIQVSRSPEITLFQKMTPGILKKSKWLISYTILAASFDIARCWNQTMVALNDVKQKVNWVMINDKLTCNQSIFNKMWDPWICCMSVNKRGLGKTLHIVLLFLSCFSPLLPSSLFTLWPICTILCKLLTRC